jgi:hypothetical protein
MERPSRREFAGTLATLVALGGFYRLAHARGAFVRPIETIMNGWVRELMQLARDVRAGRMAVTVWQERMAALHQRVPIADVLKYIDFDRVVSGVAYPKDVAAICDVALPGVPADARFGHKIFAYRRGAATPPHVHNNLVSAHLVLRGSLRARTYDRLRDEVAAEGAPGVIVLAPTRDREIRPGETVTMSDERDNGHWFVATSERAYTLDVPVAHVNLAKHYATRASEYGMIFVDPTPPPDARGRIAAPTMTFAAAVRRFGG